MERERLEKQRKKAEKEKLQKEKEGAEKVCTFLFTSNALPCDLVIKVVCIVMIGWMWKCIVMIGWTSKEVNLDSLMAF